MGKEAKRIKNEAVDFVNDGIDTYVEAQSFGLLEFEDGKVQGGPTSRRGRDFARSITNRDLLEEQHKFQKEQISLEAQRREELRQDELRNRQIRDVASSRAAGRVRGNRSAGSSSSIGNIGTGDILGSEQDFLGL